MSTSQRSRKPDPPIQRGSRRQRDHYIEVEESAAEFYEYGDHMEGDPFCCHSCREILAEDGDGAYYDEQCNVFYEEGHNEAEENENLEDAEQAYDPPAIPISITTTTPQSSSPASSPVNTPVTEAEISTPSSPQLHTPNSESDIDNGLVDHVESSWGLFSSSTIILNLSDRRRANRSYSSDLESMSDIDPAALEGLSSSVDNESWWDNFPN